MKNITPFKMLNGIMNMRHPKKIFEIFKHRPETWANKGDEIIWEELKTQLQSDIYPATVEDFTKKIETLFKAITSVAITHEESAVVNKKNVAALSNIQISPRFWQDKALPLLQVRYIITELRHSQN